MSQIVSTTSNGKHVAEELRLIEGAELIDRWWKDYVQEGVKDVIAKSKGTADFLPEEVYVCLRRQVAWLYLVVVDGKVGGFAILQKGLAEWSRAPYLNVFIGWSAKPVYSEAFFKLLPDLARKLKYNQVRFTTFREGFERKLPPGFTVAARTLVMEIPDGR